MTNRVLKAYVKNKYGYKVVRTRGGLFCKYYLMRKEEGFDGYISVVNNKLYNSISNIIDDLEQIEENEDERID